MNAPVFPPMKGLFKRRSQQEVAAVASRCKCSSRVEFQCSALIIVTAVCEAASPVSHFLREL